MVEIPNLSYMNEIANEDQDFFNRFMIYFKEEFRWEVGMYLRHIEKEEPRAAAEIVGQSKYKLSMLGLKSSYDFAEYYEKCLQVGDYSRHVEYRKILEKVILFLKTCDICNEVKN